jgi:hypothetical protein
MQAQTRLRTLHEDTRQRKSIEKQVASVAINPKAYFDRPATTINESPAIKNKNMAAI